MPATIEHKQTSTIEFCTGSRRPNRHAQEPPSPSTQLSHYPRDVHQFARSLPNQDPTPG